MGERKQHFSLSSLLMLCAAAPIWIFLCVVLPQSPGFGGMPTRFLIPPIALTGIAFAIHRLLRGKRNSIALSVFLSPIVVFSALLAASFVANQSSNLPLRFEWEFNRRTRRTLAFVRPMNLGDIYLKTFCALITTSLVLAVIVASLLRFRRCSWRTVILVALPIWLIVGFLVLITSHQRLFVAWHRWQNAILPNHGCLTYEPDFTRLYATYSMNRDEFETWVMDHPWRLHAGDNGLLHHDGARLGFDKPELSFETDSAPNGKQLRVYYKSGIMYVAYNAM